MFPVFHPISVLLCRRQYSTMWFIVLASHTSIVLWRRWVALLFQTLHGLWLPSSYRGNSCSSCYTQGTSTLWHPPPSWWRHSDYADTVHTCNKLESASCSNYFKPGINFTPKPTCRFVSSICVDSNTQLHMEAESEEGMVSKSTWMTSLVSGKST